MIKKTKIKKESNSLLAKANERLSSTRYKIDKLDLKLMILLEKRFFLTKKIVSIKQDYQLPVVQKSRWIQLLQSRLRLAKVLKLNSSFVKKIFVLIHEESVRLQSFQLKNKKTKKIKSQG